MRLSNTREEIELNIISYEFSGSEPARDGFYNYDANWLRNEAVHIKNGLIKRYYDNCILTYELNELVAGLRSLADNKTNEYRSDFMEPYLELTAMKVRQLYVITILFDIDPAKNENLEFSAAVSREEFCSAVTDLEMQAARFPERR